MAHDTIHPVPDFLMPTINKPNGQKDIPLARLIALRKKGLTYAEIGHMVGCAKETIWERLSPFIASIDNLEESKRQAADTFVVIRDGILNSLTPEDLVKSSAYQKVGMAGLLDNMRRLEEGKSTSNITTVHYTAKLSDLDAQIRALETQVGPVTPVTDESEVTDV